jgi:hypothetical protein
MPLNVPAAGFKVMFSRDFSMVLANSRHSGQWSMSLKAVVVNLKGSERQACQK